MLLGMLISILILLLFIYYLQYISKNRYEINTYLLPSNALIDSYDVLNFYKIYYEKKYL